MERGRSKGPQHRTVTALADALALEGDSRKQLVELARDGRLRDHWTRPAGLCELPRLVDDFTGRAAELVWMSELVYAESAPGAGVVGLITGSGGMGKTTLAIRAAHVLRPSFPGGVFFLDLFGMSPRPAAVADALRLLLRALGVADEQIPEDVAERASVYRSLLRDRHALVVLDNAGSEEQVRPLLPGDGASRVLITARRLLAGLEGVRRLVLGPLSLPEATELLTGILGQRAAGDEEPALDQLAELCEGMPLALRIIGNRLVSRPGWDAAELAARLADEEHRLDQFKAGDLKIATAFGMSYDQLADSARRVFRRLAVVPGPDFDAALAAVVGEVPVEVAWDALDELVDLGLLQDSAGGRYRFHDLVRLFARTRLEEEESPAEREALKARVTSVTAAADGHDGRAVVAQLALRAVLHGAADSLPFDLGAPGPASGPVPPRSGATMAIKNIVLVHGNFVDGSGWRGVYDHLTADGYLVAVVQNPTLTLGGDVAATHQVLDRLDGPAVLVGHSYGGAVITEAGNHPNVAALVYITGFAPDKGESVSSLIADPPPGAPVPPILPPVNGLLFLDRDKFAAAFAADVPEKLAAFMADSQVPGGVDALGGPVTEPAWRNKPSWYLVATDDHMIPPAAQRAMSERAKATVTETPGSHAVFISRPAVVAAVISQAAQA